jgi:hypothetical protein
MPLIDETSRGTDRRATPRWPWVLVAVGAAVLWLAIGGAVSLVPRMIFYNQQSSPSAAARQSQAQLLAQADSHAAMNDYTSAAVIVDAIDPTIPMSTSDKHTYFRVGAASKTETRNHAQAAAFHERFLGFGARIHEPECRSCHAPPSTIPPTNLSDMRTLELGTAYADALAKAGELRERRDELKAELKKRPDELRLHVLLYHLEKKLGSGKAAAEHEKALVDFDAKQR